AHLGTKVLQTRKRIDHVVSAEGLAVAPLDAAAELDGQLFEVGAVLVAAGQPQVLLVAERAVERERLVGQVWPRLVVGTKCVGVPQIVVQVLTLGTALGQQQGFAAGHFLQLAAARRGRRGGGGSGGRGRRGG